MKRTLLLCLLILSPLFLINCTGELGTRNPANFPPGNYFYTCFSCRYTGNSLSCNCYNDDDKWVATRVVMNPRCSFIINKNGRLKCRTSGYAYLPIGDYKNSCRNCRFKYYGLQCSCETRRGHRRTSVLYYPYDCKFVHNVNGVLRCR